MISVFDWSNTNGFLSDGRYDRGYSCQCQRMGFRCKQIILCIRARPYFTILSGAFIEQWHSIKQSCSVIRDLYHGHNHHLFVEYSFFISGIAGQSKFPGALCLQYLCLLENRKKSPQTGGYPISINLLRFSFIRIYLVGGLSPFTFGHWVCRLLLCK